MKYSIIVLFTVILAVMPAIPAFAQEGSEKAMPAFVKDFLGQVDFAQSEILPLEQAMPAEKAGWRPMEGVRSVSETYLHIAFGNYLMPKLMGYEPPADVNFSMDLKKWDTQTTDMAKIADILKASFDHIGGVAKKMTAKDLEKQIDFFGNTTTIRNAMMSALNHMHEHLGQSIAYARMNSVVPPWTAAEQAAEAAKKEKSGK
ncbi:MAG TPA: DinB family protein [Bacteroidota bacterium]|nr:DinB family protein [Bacteroidota bacterium]